MKKKTEVLDAPVSQPANNVKPEMSETNNIVSYVVVRDGLRVSDRNYSDSKDPDAVNELQFWTKIANDHSYGEPVKIVQYNSKEHRVW